MLKLIPSLRSLFPDSDEKVWADKLATEALVLHSHDPFTFLNGRLEQSRRARRKRIVRLAISEVKRRKKKDDPLN